jgi:purine-binding chemotaxis protein CheW
MTDNAHDRMDRGPRSDGLSANDFDWRSAGTAGGADAEAQFVSFAIGSDQYGVDIMSVREIRGWAQITFIPKQPEFVRGVLNLRGVIVPIIDLRCRFGQGLTDATPLHIVIIVQAGDRQVGLLGDRVLDIVTIQRSQIQAVPRVSQSSRIDFLSGLVTTASAMIALIDLTHLLSFVAEDLTGGRPERAAA